MLKIEEYPVINSLENILSFIMNHCRSKSPDLVSISIIIGSFEYYVYENTNLSLKIDLCIDEASLNNMYGQFRNIFTKNSSLLKLLESEESSKSQIVKLILDLIWFQLDGKYRKDKPHIQSVFSLLKLRQLDSLGVSLCVVTASNLLGLCDVKLALTESHSWIIFGRDCLESMEVTWHGRATEDLRGLKVNPKASAMKWMYQGGEAMILTGTQIIATMVSNMDIYGKDGCVLNPLFMFKLKMLQFFYDLGVLEMLPSSLVMLAELTSMQISGFNLAPLIHNNNGAPINLQPACIYNISIESSKKYYADKYVMPYVSFANYHFNSGQYFEAIKLWAKAANVISRYSYHKEDDSILRRLGDVMNKIIPKILRNAEHCSLADNDEILYNILVMYDGICRWEEGSDTQLIHSLWVQNLISAINHFTIEAKQRLQTMMDSMLVMESSDPENANNEENVTIIVASATKCENFEALKCGKTAIFNELSSLNRDSKNEMVIKSKRTRNCVVVEPTGMPACGKLNAANVESKFMATRSVNVLNNGDVEKSRRNLSCDGLDSLNNESQSSAVVKSKRTQRDYSNVDVVLSAITPTGNECNLLNKKSINLDSIKLQREGSNCDNETESLLKVNERKENSSASCASNLLPSSLREGPRSRLFNFMTSHVNKFTLNLDFVRRAFGVHRWDGQIVRPFVDADLLLDLNTFEFCSATSKEVLSLDCVSIEDNDISDGPVSLLDSNKNSFDGSNNSNSAYNESSSSISTCNKCNISGSSWNINNISSSSSTCDSNRNSCSTRWNSNCSSISLNKSSNSSSSISNKSGSNSSTHDERSCHSVESYCSTRNLLDKSCNPSEYFGDNCSLDTRSNNDKAILESVQNLQVLELKGDLKETLLSNCEVGEMPTNLTKTRAANKRSKGNEVAFNNSAADHSTKRICLEEKTVSTNHELRHLRRVPKIRKLSVDSVLTDASYIYNATLQPDLSVHRKLVEIIKPVTNGNGNTTTFDKLGCLKSRRAKAKLNRENGVESQPVKLVAGLGIGGYPALRLINPKLRNSVSMDDSICDMVSSCNDALEKNCNTDGRNKDGHLVIRTNANTDSVSCNKDLLITGSCHDDEICGVKNLNDIAFTGDESKSKVRSIVNKNSLEPISATYSGTPGAPILIDVDSKMETCRKKDINADRKCVITNKDSSGDAMARLKSETENFQREELEENKQSFKKSFSKVGQTAKFVKKPSDNCKSMVTRGKSCVKTTVQNYPINGNVNIKKIVSTLDSNKRLDTDAETASKSIDRLIDSDMQLSAFELNDKVEDALEVTNRDQNEMKTELIRCGELSEDVSTKPQFSLRMIKSESRDHPVFEINPFKSIKIKSIIRHLLKPSSNMQTINLQLTAQISNSCKKTRQLWSR